MMEIFRRLGNLRPFVFSFGIIVLLLSHVNAGADESPFTKVNLSPFWQWRSAYECMQNTSTACTNKDITIAGVVEVNSTELKGYCNGGCAEHTRRVLYCISLVHRHFWFANGLSVHSLNNTINNGCTQNKPFNTIGVKSSSTKRNQNIVMSFVSSIATLILISIFTI